VLSIGAVGSTKEEDMNPIVTATIADAHVADLHRTAAEYRRARVSRRHTRRTSLTPGSWHTVSATPARSVCAD